MDGPWNGYSRGSRWVAKNQSDRPEEGEWDRARSEAKQCWNNGETPQRAGRQAPGSQQRGIGTHAGPGMYDATRQEAYSVQGEHEDGAWEKQKGGPG